MRKDVVDCVLSIVFTVSFPCFSVSENADRIPVNGGSVPEISDSVAEKEEFIPVFQFGSKETFALSFAELAKQTSGFPKTSEGTWKGFLGSGGQLFSSNVEDDPEREVEGTDFKPIVSLPDVIEQKTGEEDETVVYSHRAKLFRYDVDTKQWKERGVGDIKILLHNETKRSRVVMRRDQIHKLCANHYITADMDLKENAGSDRSWVWSVEADFSDGVAKKELLAVRFKHHEDAVMFRDKFIECQEKNELKESEVKTAEEDETVVYSHRATLFRYDVDTKQWKERGVGDIKILLHNETKRSRVVMRRKQNHKLCANHYITADMDLKKNAGSDRSWVWSVDADFSDGVAKKELLAVRFRHHEDAVMFRDRFIECQEKKKLKESEVTSVEEKPSDDDDDDDVVILFEKVPSPEQKERAQLYELPPTFYCFEQDLEDDVEKNSDGSVEEDLTRQTQER